jgi:hypothetical protein
VLGVQADRFDHEVELIGAVDLARYAVGHSGLDELGFGEVVDLVFDLVRGDSQKQSFLVSKEGGHLVSATQPVSQEDAATHRVSGVMMRLAPSGETHGRIGHLLEANHIPRRRGRVPARGCGPGMEGYCQKPTNNSWDVTQWAGRG